MPIYPQQLKPIFCQDGTGEILQYGNCRSRYDRYCGWLRFRRQASFASSFAIFAAGRAYEQIRNAVAYQKLNVTIAATHAGVTVGEDGGSHQAIEDIALMRAIPGMTIINPVDDLETEAAIETILAHEGPVYLRLGRLAVERVHEEKRPL